MSQNDALFTDEPAPRVDDSLFTDEPAPAEISKTESFLRGAGNNFPLAPQAISVGEKLLPGNKGYSENLADWNQKAADAKTANPKTYGAGAVTGTVAPLFIPGVGEALEAAPLAGNAALGAASSISNTDLVKNPEKALKEGAVGAGTGALTAAILGKLIPTGEGLSNFADKKAIQSIEMPGVGEMLPEERKGLADFIQGNNLVGRDKSQVLEHARSLSEKFGSKIGEIADKAGEEGLTLDPESHLSKITDLLEKGEAFKGSANREAKALARDYTAGASDILNLSDNPSWSSIQKLKEQYGHLAFDSKGEIKSKGASDTYFALKDMLKSIADKAQGSNLAPEYKEALAGYSQMQPIETALEKSVNSEFKGGAGMGVRGLAGLIKKLPGPVRAVAGPLAVASGHPIVGLAAALPELTDSALQSKAAAGLAKVASEFPEGSPEAINQMIRQYLISRYQNAAH